MAGALCLALTASVWAGERGAAPAAGSAESVSSMPSPETVERALAEVYPALVNIRVVSQQFSEGRSLRFPSAGSGVIVTDKGHVLTNFHVAGESLRIQCALTSGEVIDATVVAHDPLTDLSVLQLRPDRMAARGRPIAHARLGDSSRLQVGDPVLAMGNPFALSSSVTLGIVSNPRRVFTDFTGTDIENMDLGGGQTTGIFTQWIQHDALILPGNSGGPLVNLQGEVVGINEMGGGGIGFAIPSRVAAEVLRQALAFGEVRRAWLGFTVLPVGRLGRSTGALVASVAPGSPAEAGGLVAGDYLLRLAGEPVEVQFFEQVPELYQRVAALPLGKPVELEIERDGKSRELTLATTQMEKMRGEEAEFHDLGVTLQEITGPMVLALQLPLGDGLLVTGVRPGSPAATARPQLAVNDVLTAIGGQPAHSLAALRELLARRGGSDLLVAVRRGEEELLTLVREGERRSGRSGGELPKAWLGLRTQVLTPELAGALGRPQLRGFRVSEVFPWTEASRAGLKVGDLLLAVDGEPLDATRPQDAEDLRRIVEERAIGDRLALKVLREGEEREVEVLLEPRPAEAQEARQSRQEDLEFSVRELTLLDRIRFRWQRDQQGVLVTEISQGGWAQMAGLRVDDLVIRVDSHEVKDVESFEIAMKQALAENPCLVQLFVRRGYRTHFVFIEPQGGDTACPAAAGP